MHHGRLFYTPRSSIDNFNNSSLHQRGIRIYNFHSSFLIHDVLAKYFIPSNLEIILRGQNANVRVEVIRLTRISDILVAGTAQDLRAAARDGEGLLPHAHGEVGGVDAGLDGDGDGVVAAARHRQLGGFGQHRGDEDDVREVLDAVGRAERVSRARRVLGRCPVPVHHLVRLHRRRVRARLIRCDVRCPEGAEAVVRVAAGPGARAVVGVVGLVAAIVRGASVCIPDTVLGHGV